VQFVAPDSYTITLAIALFLGMVVGGMGRLPGSIVGSALIIFAPNIAESVSKGLSGAVSAAKLGIVGLSQSIALDLARYNVRSNCIAPFAWSRLATTIPSDSEADAKRIERMKLAAADKIAPLVAFLASDSAAEVTNQIFGVRKNEIFLFSKPRPVRSLHRSEGWTPETITTELLPAFRSSFYGLDRSADIFSWDPI